MSTGHGQKLDFNGQFFFDFCHQLQKNSFSTVNFCFFECPFFFLPLWAIVSSDGHKNSFSTVIFSFSRCPYFFFATFGHIGLEHTQKLILNSQFFFFGVPVLLFCHFGAPRSCAYKNKSTLEHLGYRRIKRNRVFAFSF